MSDQDHPYGPNGSQVSSFLERMKSLTPEQLDNVGYGYHVDFQQLQKDAPLEAHGYLGKVTDAIHDMPGLHSRSWLRWIMAASALVWADWLPEHQLALMYGPIRHLIPIEDLAPGIAPTTHEQDEAVYSFASAIEDGRGYAREETRNYYLLMLSFVAAVTGAGAGFAAGGWSGLVAFLSIATLFVISLWAQNFETSWTMPWRRD